jgi:hypothetical protein
VRADFGDGVEVVAAEKDTEVDELFSLTNCLRERREGGAYLLAIHS